MLKRDPRSDRGKPPNAVAVLAIGMMALTGTAMAQICDTRWPQLQFARDDLQRAAGEGDLASAQDFADRARREFDQLAALAIRCGCPPAASAFEEANVRIRRAQEAESRKDLREIINNAKATFEGALPQLESCRKR